MPRIRTVKPTFWTHPVMGKLPDDVQLLAIALLTMADDEGYFRADPVLVRGAVQPYREDLERIREGLAMLSRAEWVEIVQHPQQGPIGRVKTWSTHQRVDHPKDSKLKKYFTEASSDTDLPQDHRDSVANDSRSAREIVAPEKEKEKEKECVSAARTPTHTEGMGPDGFARGLVAIWQEQEQVPGALGLARDIADLLPKWADQAQ